MASHMVNYESVTSLLNDSTSHLGFESYALKIGWYNGVLPAALRLPRHEDTLAVVVLSTPGMFERAFLPFLEQGCCQGVSDPIDQCVKHTIGSAVSQCFAEQKVEVSYDYEMLPSRKPKFLAQTAAHVAGAAYYYQQADVTDHPWGTKKKFGVCIHPRFGGWFAIRALLVFEGVRVGRELVQSGPPDCVPSRDARIQLLEDFNLRWQDWSYRDVVAPVQRYSQRQMDYFSARPAQRPALLVGWGFLQNYTEEEEEEEEEEEGGGEGDVTYQPGQCGVHQLVFVVGVVPLPNKEEHWSGQERTVRRGNGERVDAEEMVVLDQVEFSSRDSGYDHRCDIRSPAVALE
ncbi:hypothetical protein NHX12_033504 [Muraenolepis orangiensis]|uniref:Cyanocobalamin reductase / alkylcobalamin dealkylase n=1 Tax=Muraenolepis orangiensis TaxID=630683 RepID=A0A9Q0IIR6_9TELE|nr:hypothetical protein NHX12_033504 [Muraenolepis orangiensis]